MSKNNVTVSSVAVEPTGEDPMSQYGPLSVYSLATADIVSPGMPTFVSAVQVDNTIIRLKLAMPTMDSNGGNLTGLAKLTIVSLAMTGGVNPFQGKSMTDCLALAGVQKVDVTITPTDAGQQKTVDVNVMNLGGSQAFAAACAD